MKLRELLIKYDKNQTMKLIIIQMKHDGFLSPFLNAAENILFFILRTKQTTKKQTVLSN